MKLTSPKAPKYSLMASSVASGFNPPTKIFLAGSFFMAIAFLGSMGRPSSLCSFCSSTCRRVIIIIERYTQSMLYKNNERVCERRLKSFDFSPGCFSLNDVLPEAGVNPPNPIEKHVVFIQLPKLQTQQPEASCLLGLEHMCNKTNLKIHDISETFFMSC